MAKLFLSEGMLARSFWSAIEGSPLNEDADADVRKIIKGSLNQLKEFKQEAGSIGPESCKALWLLSRYFSPKVICEIGTYIGRSTMSLYLGAGSNLEHLYTCDGTFDCWDKNCLKNNFSKAEIHYFGKTMSTEMLGELIKLDKKIDLLFIDGRISSEDINMLRNLITSGTVIVLDDFMGVEKGVINAVMLREAFRGYMLFDPIEFPCLNTLL